jgi:hypothetical protein
VRASSLIRCIAFHFLSVPVLDDWICCCSLLQFRDQIPIPSFITSEDCPSCSVWM